MDRRNLITDSEWQVMRVLWENSPQTAAQITFTLFDAKEWGPTTVKTFLSRLTAKELIAYERQNKGYSYYPIVSERYCVKQEMKAVLNRVYGGKILLETEHFLFYGDNNPSYIRKLADSLEEQYPRLTRDLEYTQKEKQMVYVYSSQKRFHSALGLENGPAWLRAGWEWDILHIAPEATFVNLNPALAIVHVFAEVIVHQINETLPLWLLQGVAAYESHWLTKDQIIDAIEKNQDHLDIHSIKDLTNRYDEFKENRGYELAYTVIEHIVKTYGHVKLVRFIKTPELLSMHFACEEARFWQDWLVFVKSQYLSGGSIR